MTYPKTKSHKAAVLLMKQQKLISREHKLYLNTSTGSHILTFKTRHYHAVQKTNISIHNVHKVKFRCTYSCNTLSCLASFLRYAHCILKALSVVTAWWLSVLVVQACSSCWTYVMFDSWLIYVPWKRNV
jgi:hypothetical protein